MEEEEEEEEEDDATVEIKVRQCEGEMERGWKEGRAEIEEKRMEHNSLIWKRDSRVGEEGKTVEEDG